MQVFERTPYLIYWYEDSKTFIIYDPIPTQDLIHLKNYLKKVRWDYDNIIVKSREVHFGYGINN